MKKILSLILCIALFSCKKNNGDPGPPVDAGSISYKVNGTLITMDNKNNPSGEGAIFAKQLAPLLPQTRYQLNAQKGSGNLLGFTILSDSLHETNYHYDSSIIGNNFVLYTFNLAFNGQPGVIFFKGDKLDITISSYKNGSITGTFSGNLTPIAGAVDYNLRGTLSITEGVINNVPVTY